MYAVIKTGGKQYRVAPGDTIRIERVDGKVGEKVNFGSVLSVHGDDKKVLTGADAAKATAPVRTFLSSPWTDKTDPKLTFSPTFPSTRSMRMVSPGATRYCFPPVLITAYIVPPGAKDKP